MHKTLPRSRCRFKSGRPLYCLAGSPSVKITRRTPLRRAVRRRWQFAQTTSHFSISSRIVRHLRSRSDCPIVNDLSPRWSNSRTMGSDSPQSAHWVCLEVLEEVDRSLAGKLSLRGGGLIDVSLPVGRVVLPSICRTARAAEGVALSACLPPPSEVLDGLELPASIALAQIRLSDHEHMFADAGRKTDVNSEAPGRGAAW